MLSGISLPLPFTPPTAAAVPGCPKGWGSSRAAPTPFQMGCMGSQALPHLHWAGSLSWHVPSQSRSRLREGTYCCHCPQLSQAPSVWSRTGMTLELPLSLEQLRTVWMTAVMNGKGGNERCHWTWRGSQIQGVGGGAGRQWDWPGRILTWFESLHLLFPQWILGAGVQQPEHWLLLPCFLLQNPGSAHEDNVGILHKENTAEQIKR